MMNAYRAGMTELCKLSEDMIVQILARLPPKSLMRFKCVRKSWNALINNPSFVAKHLSNSMDTKLSSSTCILLEPCQLLVGTDSVLAKDLWSWLNLCNDNDSDEHNLQSLVEDLNIPLYPDPNRELIYLKSVGHCHGIICLTDYSENNFLCNPAIGEFKLLPKSCLLLPPPEEEGGLETMTKVMGFGYDPKAKDYKVVRIVLNVTDEGRNFLPHTTEIYTMGTDSWREMKIDLPSSPYKANFEMYFKGIYYWPARWKPMEDYEDVILSFDMGDEVFCNISLPDCNPLPDCNSLLYDKLAVWNESIAYFSSEVKDGLLENCEVWVMDDFGGVKGSWTKHLTIRSLVGIEIPLVFWKSDELLMVATNETVVSYNVSKQTLQYLPFLPKPGNPKFFQAIVYVNSIVPVKQGNKLGGIDIS